MPSPLLAPVCPQVETSVSSTECFLEHFPPSALIFLTDEKNSWMFLATNLAVHSRVAIFADVPNTQAAETDSPPPSENWTMCPLLQPRALLRSREQHRDELDFVGEQLQHLKLLFDLLLQQLWQNYFL